MSSTNSFKNRTNSKAIAKNSSGTSSQTNGPFKSIAPFEINKRSEINLSNDRSKNALVESVNKRKKDKEIASQVNKRPRMAPVSSSHDAEQSKNNEAIANQLSKQPCTNHLSCNDDVISMFRSQNEKISQLSERIRKQRSIKKI